MSNDRVLVEELARKENDWVLARILSRDPPPEGSLLDIAERARDMAANSLGTQHSAYAVSLQNLGVYYDFIENDTSKAKEFFGQARAVLKDNDLPLAYRFFKLGVFHYENSPDKKRAEMWLMEALAIQRRGLGGDDLQLADTLIALAYAKGMKTGGSIPAQPDVQSAIALMEEALRIRRAKLAPTDSAVLDTEKRLAIFQALATLFGDRKV
jgi:tetratricopeptide (TPR) repeat protein